MLIVAYDFRSNKTRARFAKFLSKFGYRIQLSVFKIKNSRRVLANIIKEVDLKYKKDFTNSDTILIFDMCAGCDKKVHKYGYAANEDSDILFMD